MNPPNGPDYYIAYENFDHTLETLVADNHLMSNNLQVNILDILRDAIEGIYYIHKNKMTHRDIYPPNIMICPLNDSHVGKISNLALSKEFKPNSSVQSISQKFKPNGFVAPELCDFNGPYLDGVDTAVDVFSMGCVIFYALTGEYLFACRGTEMQENIKNKNFEPNYETLDDSALLKKWQVEFAKQLIKKMVMRNPSQRPTAAEVMKHPIFWNSKQIGEFFETASAHVGGDKNLKAIIECDGSNYSDWGKDLHEEMKKFILKGTKGKSVTNGAPNLLRFIRNLVSRHFIWFIFNIFHYYLSARTL